MKALLVDRLGFERVTKEEALGHTFIVPRRFVPGQSEFKWFGPIHRDGEELIEYREADDMAEEMKQAHSMTEYLRGEVRRLEGVVRRLEQENGALALELKRRG
jgi:hypothetical protein